MSTVPRIHRTFLGKILAVLALGASVLIAQQPKPPKQPPAEDTKKKAEEKKAEQAATEARLRTLLETRQQKFGPEHPETLEATYILSIAVANRSQKEALQLATHARNVAIKTLGREHRNTIIYQHWVEQLSKPR